MSRLLKSAKLLHTIMLTEIQQWLGVIRMSIQEIVSSEKVFLTVADIAPILHCDPQCIRRQAKEDPEVLGFPILQIGSRIRIPRIPFLKFLGVL